MITADLAGFAFAVSQAFVGLWQMLLQDPLRVNVLLFPMLLLLELPYYLAVLAGLMRHVLRRRLQRQPRWPHQPRVTCLITCYSEGEAVALTLHTLCEQDYAGPLDIIAMVDGAIQNRPTAEAVRRFIRTHGKHYPHRYITLLPKWQRGGRVSSLNAGLSLARGEIVMALDGDTSFDNDMVSKVVRHFVDPKVAAVSGTLMARNAATSTVAHLQGLEYRLSLLMAKTGLGELDVLNNISGAFGVFRTSVLRQIGAWNTGTAEDLDLTLRLKQYVRRYGLRIVFEPYAVGHTDVPHTWRMFFLQRLRWDGDLAYLYLRKHHHAFSPRLTGWRHFIALLWSGLAFQIVAPFTILFYLVWLAFVLPAANYVALQLLVFCYYLLIAAFNYLAYLAVCSREPWRELKDLLWLPVFTLYMMASRLWSCVAILNEMLRRGHEESAMAPWWVLKRTTRH